MRRSLLAVMLLAWAAAAAMAGEKKFTVSESACGTLAPGEQRIELGDVNYTRVRDWGLLWWVEDNYIIFYDLNKDYVESTAKPQAAQAFKNLIVADVKAGRTVQLAAEQLQRLYAKIERERFSYVTTPPLDSLKRKGLGKGLFSSSTTYTFVGKIIEREGAEPTAFTIVDSPLNQTVMMAGGGYQQNTKRHIVATLTLPGDGFVKEFNNRNTFELLLGLQVSPDGKCVKYDKRNIQVVGAKDALEVNAKCEIAKCSLNPRWNKIALLIKPRGQKAFLLIKDFAMPAAAAGK